MDSQFCPVCHFPVTETSYFCPNCGKKIKEPPVSVTIGKQISIYAISILLPPLGFWPGIKYVMQEDQKAKTVGLIAIVLTIISTILTLWLSFAAFNLFNQAMNTQTQQLQNLGL